MTLGRPDEIRRRCRALQGSLPVHLGPSLELWCRRRLRRLQVLIPRACLVALPPIVVIIIPRCLVVVFQVTIVVVVVVVDANAIDARFLCNYYILRVWVGGPVPGEGGVFRFAGRDAQRSVYTPSARELGVKGARKVVVLEVTKLHVVAHPVAVKVQVVTLLQLSWTVGCHRFLVGEYRHHELARFEGIEHAPDDFFVRCFRNVALEGDVGKLVLRGNVNGHVASLLFEKSRLVKWA